MDASKPDLLLLSQDRAWHTLNIQKRKVLSFHTSRQEEDPAICSTKLPLRRKHHLNLKPSKKQEKDREADRKSKITSILGEIASLLGEITSLSGKTQKPFGQKHKPFGLTG